MMTHNRFLLIGAVGLVKGKVRNDIPALTKVHKNLDAILKQAHWNTHAPFKLIILMLLFGDENKLTPKYRKIKKDGSLEIFIELKLSELQSAGRNLEELTNIFSAAIIEGLIQVAGKYSLPDNLLINEREKYSVSIEA